MHERWVRLDSGAFDGTPPEVIALRGTEAINELFELQVELLVHDPATARERAERLLNEPVTLTFEDGGVAVRRVHGMVSALSYRHEVDTGRGRISLTVVPRVWKMTRRFGAELFLDATVPEVLQRKLEAIGLEEGMDFVLMLTEQYPLRELIVQHEETDYAFFSRLCEHDGIIAIFKHDGGRDRLVLTDTTGAFESIAHQHAIPVRDRRDHPSAYDVETTLAHRSETSLVHDYNYRAPQLALDASARITQAATSNTWVEYGAHTKSPDETQRIAKIRSEAIDTTYEVICGGSSELSMCAGSLFSLEHAIFGEQRLLITRLTFTADHTSADDRNWDARFEAIPAGVPFRPERRTPRPRIPGLIGARVDGEIKGHYAELDSMGRYHVQIGFDRSGRTDLKASHPVRMMQPHAGANYGMHFPLRPGTEVLVGFVDGNPDRPIIVGCAPNPETRSPVEATNFTKNVLRTKSDNELVIEDRLGSERIRLHTPHQLTTFQLGSEEEPEIGALTTTEGSISHASIGSFNVATSRKTALVNDVSTIAGNNSVLLAGVGALVDAAGRGLNVPGALRGQDIVRDLEMLTLSPDDFAEARADGEEEQEGERDEVEEGGQSMANLWSTVGDTLTESAQSAAFGAIRSMAVASDETLDNATGRFQGNRLGSPNGPASIIGAPGTAAMFGRDTAFVYGDRVAMLSSHDTAAVVGAEIAELKSPGRAEVAGGSEVAVTSLGEFSVESDTVRMTAGYYPVPAPELDEGTTFGVMSRRDLRLTSVEDCILICAKKNLIGSAHEGDIRMVALNAIELTTTGPDSTISLTSPTIELDSDNTTIKATEKVEIEAARVVIYATKGILLHGSVTITGNLTVGGKLDVKDDTTLASG